MTRAPDAGFLILGGATSAVEERGLLTTPEAGSFFLGGSIRAVDRSFIGGRSLAKAGGLTCRYSAIKRRLSPLEIASLVLGNDVACKSGTVTPKSSGIIEPKR
jgi:hypothetical protein